MVHGGEAKSLTDHPKYGANVYGDILSRTPCKSWPVRRAFAKATIPLKQGYRLRDDGRAQAGHGQDLQAFHLARVDSEVFE